jgi:hypothetical protein
MYHKRYLDFRIIRISLLSGRGLSLRINGQGLPLEQILYNNGLYN